MDLQEATIKALQEDHEYYYKVANVLDKFDNGIQVINDIRNEITKVQSNIDDNTKIDALDSTKLYLEKTIKEFEDVEEKLKKLFPEKLRSLTPEEKEYIDSMKTEGVEEEYDTMAFAQLLPMSFTDYVDDHIYDFLEEDEDDCTPDDVADYFINEFKEDLDEEDAEEFDNNLARKYIKYKIDQKENQEEDEE